MKALISTTESRQKGYRVAQLVQKTFPVSESMFWVDFPAGLDPDLVQYDQFWYDPSDQTIKQVLSTEV